MKYIIALDVGTSSMRSVLYGADGQILFTSGQEYHTFFPAPSQVEQDPATWKEAACKTPGVAKATVNFMTLKMIVEFLDGHDPKTVMQQVRANCKRVEDDCEVYL